MFDLDGTITDPAIGITRSVQYALKKFGINARCDELTNFIGPPLYDSFPEYFGFSREDTLKAVEYYREFYNAGAIYELTICDGIADALACLRSAGRELIVATAKPKVMAEKILEKFELSEYFSGVYGCELDGTRSKKEEVIAWAIKNQPIDPSRAIMVGDRMHDIVGARINGIPTIGVLWGYGSREEFSAYSAEFVVSNTDELKKILLE